VETLLVQKMRDEAGNVIELIEGNYHPHIAVNWLEDEDGNWIELVEVKK
jgi:catechol 2,3-dioxygenase-like lactoylglutathione lyase family enzyme